MEWAAKFRRDAQEEHRENRRDEHEEHRGKPVGKTQRNIREKVWMNAPGKTKFENEMNY